MTHKIVNGYCPEYFKKYLRYARDTHGFNTRLANNLTSEIRTPSQTVAKAELFLSTLGLTANDMMVSFYETRTGIKVPSQHLPSSQSGWLSLPVTKMMNQLLAREGTSFRFKALVKKRGRNETDFDLRPLQVPRIWLVMYAEADHEHNPSLYWLGTE